MSQANIDNTAYDLRCFAEGVRIPIKGCTRQQSRQSFTFSITLSAVAEAWLVPPGTLFHVFVRERSASDPDGQYVLFAEGKMKSRGSTSARAGHESVQIHCEGITSEWAQFQMGFQMSAGSEVPLPRLMKLFIGQTAAPEDGDEGSSALFKGQEAAEAAVRTQMLVRSTDPALRYNAFYPTIVRMLKETGPVTGILGILSNMHAFSPLYRQMYNSLKVFSRFAYAENKTVTNYLAQEVYASVFTQRLQSLPNSASVWDMVNLFLPDTLHDLIYIPSPYVIKKVPSIQPTPSRAQLETYKRDEPYRSDITPHSSLAELREDPRIKAMLDVIARSEVGMRSERDQYRTMVGHGYFADMTKHPNEKVYVPAIDDVSTAAGRYQILYKTWKDVANGAGLTDFSPYSQDIAAIYLLRENGVLGSILDGDFSNAVWNVSNIWASFPTASGKGAYAMQGVSYDIHEMAEYYNERLGVYDSNAPKVSSAPKAAEYKERHGEIAQIVIKPMLHFAPPPMCNVIFEHSTGQVSVMDRTSASPTRMMLVGRPISEEIYGGTLSSIIRSYYFAPRYLQFIFDALRGYDRTAQADLSTGKEREAYTKVITNYLDGIKGSMQSPDTNPAFIDRVLTALAQIQVQSQLSQSDLLSAISEGQVEVPQGLMGMHTYEEIFRGISPHVAQFPYYEYFRGETDQDIEETLQSQVKGNSEVINTLLPGADTHFAAKTSEQSEVLTVGNLYANYQMALMRRSARQATYTGSLNMNLVRGFTGAVRANSIGWVVGEISEITDTVDSESRVATSQVTFNNCTFMRDYESDIYRRMIMEMEADALVLDEAGFPEVPMLYDEEYGRDMVGEKIYEPLLGTRSVIDFAKKALGAEGSMKSVLEAVGAYYDERGQEVARAITRRQKATEEDIMQNLLRGTPKGGALETEGAASYEAPYEAVVIPDEDASFMKERSDWAHRLAAQLAKSDHTK